MACRISLSIPTSLPAFGRLPVLSATLPQG
jgi:hypothetical protein